QANAICNKQLRELSETRIDVKSAVIQMTATIGITELLPPDTDVNTVIRRADAALYRGKAAGRNRVEIYSR
ncbi:MAG: diguanylate cyclase, partial [Smithellaceae bacterium]